MLDKHDPGFMKAQALPAQGTGSSSVASLYQLSLGVERFRLESGTQEREREREREREIWCC